MKKVDLLNRITRVVEIKIIKINSFKNGVFSCVVFQNGTVIDMDIDLMFIKILFDTYIVRMEHPGILKTVEHLSTSHISEFKKYCLNDRDYRYIKIYKWILKELKKNNKEF